MQNGPNVGVHKFSTFLETASKF